MSAPCYEFVVEHELRGIRIDSFLTKHLRNYTPWRIQRIVREGGVSINEMPAFPTDRVMSGQRVRILLIEPPDKLLTPEQMDIPILHRDPWMLVVNKPAGIISHPVGQIQSQTLVNGLQELLDQRTGRRGILRPGIVHRLDRQTSGVMAVALTHNAHASLSAAFESSRVAKTYLALVEGRIAGDQGVLDWPIGRAKTGRHVLMSCRGDAIDRRPARTNFEVVRRFEQHTLVLAKPRTGRNHQIRVHFAHLGHPLVGDEFYERNGNFKPFYEELPEDADREIDTGLPIRRHALHALTLELAHPVTGTWMKFSAPVPEDFRQTLDVLSLPSRSSSSV